MTLRSGRTINVLDLQPSDILLDDIAWSLSHTNRFNGHGPYFLSTAEHCIQVADALPDHLKLQGLLHDAAEAYIGDMCHDLKHTDLMKPYRDLEARIESVIFPIFGFTELDPLVKAVDKAMGWTDWLELLYTPGTKHGSYWMGPGQAYEQFLKYVHRLTHPELTFEMDAETDSISCSL